MVDTVSYVLEHMNNLRIKHLADTSLRVFQYNWLPYLVDWTSDVNAIYRLAVSDPLFLLQGMKW